MTMQISEFGTFNENMQVKILGSEANQEIRNITEHRCLDALTL